MLPQKVLDRKSLIFDYLGFLGVDTKNIKDENLMLQAFVHKSFAADFKKIQDHNERLEFLGDGILGAIICKLLFLDHPEMDEAEMTLYKIALVREENLAQVAKNIKLDQQIIISKGEEKMNGRKKNSILSDALEAFLGYLFIDFGYNEAERFIKENIYTMYDKINKNPVQSYKTMVQEVLQKKIKETPIYKDLEQEADNKGNVILYKSEIFVRGTKEAEGFGTNKKKAQEDAAKNLYNKW